MSVYSILGCFFTASTAEKSEGLSWYNNAHQRALAISDDLNVSPDVVCGVIAALSPNNRWERNLSDASTLLKIAQAGGSEEDLQAAKVSTFGRNKDKAIRIIREPGPDIMTILSGRKVQAFFACILDPERVDYVCVDGHAYSVWLGERVPTTKTPSISAKLYNQISQDYAQAAGIILDVTGDVYTPAQVQAITWVAWRNLHATLGRHGVQS